MAIKVFIRNESARSSVAGFFFSNGYPAGPLPVVAGVDLLFNSNDPKTLSAEDTSIALQSITAVAPVDPCQYFDFSLTPKLKSFVTFNDRFNIAGYINPEPNVFCKDLISFTSQGGTLISNLSGLTALQSADGSSSYNRSVTSTNFNGCSSFASADFRAGGVKLFNFLGAQNFAVANIGNNPLTGTDIIGDFARHLSLRSLSGSFTSLSFDPKTFTNTYPVCSQTLGPNSLTALSALQSLNLSKNYITDTTFPLVPALVTLQLTDNPSLSNIAFSSPMPALQNLYLNNDSGFNKLSSVNVGSLSALRYLNLTQSNLRNLTDITNLSAISGLQTLLLGTTFLRELDFSYLPQSFSVETLNAAACNLLSATNLNNLSATNSSGYNLKYLTLNNCTSLSSLDISTHDQLLTLTVLSDIQLRTLILPAINCNLQEIYVTGTALSAFNYPSLVKLKTLTLGASISSASFNTLSSLGYLSLDRTRLTNVTLSGLSALNTFISRGNRALSSFNAEVALPALSSVSFTSVTTNHNQSLSSVSLTGQLALKTVTITNTPVTFVDVSDCPVLNDFSLYGNIASVFPRETKIQFNNLPSLKEITIYNNTNLNTLEFTNTQNISNFNVFANSLTSKNLFDNINSNSLINATIYGNSLSGSYNFERFFNLTTVNASYNSLTAVTVPKNAQNISLYQNKLSSFETTGLSALNYLNLGNNFLSSISTAGLSALITLGVGENRLSSFNLDPVCKRVTTIFLGDNDLTYCNVTPATALVSLDVSNNNLSSISLPAGWFPESNNIIINDNQLNSDTIDNFIISLCAANAFVPTIQYYNNLKGRTTYSDEAYTHLVNYGFATFVPDEPVGTVGQPVPFISNINIPGTLAYNTSATLSAFASYLTNEFNVYYTVTNGPGIITNTNVLSAYFPGTITLVVSTLSTTQFYPATAQFDISVPKTDVSNLIAFSGYNAFLYDGNIKQVNPYVIGTPGVAFNTTYFKNSAVTLPITTGTYVVSSYIVNPALSGTAYTTLYIFDPDTTYTLPTTCTSSVVYSPSGYDTIKDLVVTFQYACYGGTDTAGEGFCVSFVSGTTTVSGGAPGYGLNYTNANILTSDGGTNVVYNTYPGLFGAQLGIGFDVTGLFGASGSEVSPNSIAIRSGNSDNYNLLYRTPNLTSFASPITLYEKVTAGEPNYKFAFIRITNLGKTVIVKHKDNAEDSYETVVNYNLDTPLPNAVRPCISFSTGMTAAKFAVKSFEIHGFYNNSLSAI
jgi:hypothetical protein